MDNKSIVDEITPAESWSYTIEEIYLKIDGSYLVTLDGCPYHATEEETPEVFRAIRLLIDSGAQYQDFLEPISSDADAQANERIWRDSEIQRISWMRERQRDQMDMGLKTALTTQQFKELLAYIQALRDWPQVDSFPVVSKRPEVLPWLEAITR